MNRIPLALLFLLAAGAPASGNPAFVREEQAIEVLEYYCFECHDAATKKGDFNMEKLIEEGELDGALMFENLLTGRMPPAKKEQPDAGEKRTVLEWLAARKQADSPKSFRRISRHEFVHAVNDLLGTDLDLTAEIPEDRGTNDVDSNRRIQLSREVLESYFAVADEMLDHAFPAEGFEADRTWVTSKVKESHTTYRIYHRPYKEGILFSWMRSNIGIRYSYFYDGFDPPVAGWYDLTFDAATVGEFEDDMSLMVLIAKKSLFQAGFPGGSGAPSSSRLRRTSRGGGGAT
ncbi:MAG: DUF1587 domain-containing protein [Akkermansiaceae bacterium]|nr:DUF1587 domain-containing protein [Akkermansiaceae bacterium]NNM28692.1 DUF1587 domain-containing protein [Akkermansiaceae bacterium]